MASIFESPEMIGAFIAEVEEQLQMLENSIISLEQNGETEEHVHELFRIAHTLKGCSATMGFEKMKNLAHELENVLDSIRNGFLKISGPVTDVLFDCLDCLRMLKDDYVSDANNIKTDINPVINKLKAITASGNKQEDNPDKAGNAEVEHSKSVIFALDTKQREQINHALEIGQNVLVCEISISEDSQMKSTRACLIMNFLNEWGTVVSMVPNVLEVPVDSDICNVAFLVITQMSAAALEHKARNDLMDVSDVKVFPYSVDTAEHVIKAYETETRDMDNASCAKTPGDEKRLYIPLGLMWIGWKE
ncbi:Hpt domain-containing protein [Thermoclostridium stercorarium]|uniref:Hpt domain-containing protein n=1 Tax=Thermoclostridium stercorarium TaxID=1510 RepID=UPI002248F46D|nr:Hpt domain-containing protein [Thermoclostridium stercorarium]UZQ84739.1 Hpt domain-containing protein [Thermoclostridium stercorarium]